MVRAWYEHVSPRELTRAARKCVEFENILVRWAFRMLDNSFDRAPSADLSHEETHTEVTVILLMTGGCMCMLMH